MFQRRLKIFLGLLVLLTGTLLVRALQVQVMQHAHWQQQAAKAMTQGRLIETTRGSILDRHGRIVAADTPCFDACVDYRAIIRQPDAKWLKALALDRLKSQLGDAWSRTPPAQRDLLLADATAVVQAEISAMWTTLARESGKPPEEIDAIRQSIVQRVEMQRRYLWYARYSQALQQRENQGADASWLKQWLLDELRDAPPLDSFAADVSEQTEAHAVLRDIPIELSNRLSKNLARYPGLVIKPGVHRRYPYGEAACHVLGHLSRVNKDDLQHDPNLGVDKLRQYYPNDLIGRTGIEALCEPALRGARGRVEHIVGQDEALSEQAPVPGQDVFITLDMELQIDMQKLFRQGIDGHEMHGAAVVIDVPTGELRALVSYPTFDLNTLDDNYAAMLADEINTPLMNRATQAQLEPGSTIKPACGLAGLAQGVIGLHDGVECTGYLVLNGKRFTVGRCWTASQFAHKFGDGGVAHHPFPVPHRGVFNNPDGHLIYADALERSCNVYFETVADRLGLDRLSAWYERFGFGHITGLGIAEASGRLPGEYDGPAAGRRMTTWMAGIGQGEVAATPVQMANLAATIARDGLWVRPHLVRPGTSINDARLIDPKTRQPVRDRVDLKLPREALAAARDGMTRVVNAKGGTGRALNYDLYERRVLPVTVAGKTGTAQAARFSVPLRDAEGRIVRDERGRAKREFLEPSTNAWTNPKAPWYRATSSDNGESHLNHAWFIGFAPANNPQIAFAVLVEYGGGGGGAVAGPIARHLLEACAQHGYLALDPK